MAKSKKDPVRENRISDEVIVDAYGPEEQAMGWYYYLQNKICFPFRAKCTASKQSCHHYERERLSRYGAWHPKISAPPTCSSWFASTAATCRSFVSTDCH